MPVPENKLIEQLKNEDNASFEILYRFYFPVISTYIRQNNGSKEDAGDIFQETVVVLLRKVRQPDFELTSSLKTYLFSIARNLWLKRLRDNKLISSDFVETMEFPSEIELLPLRTDEEKLNTWLSKITQHCQRIIQALYFFNEPMANLMQKMGWKNRHTAANQQYKCIQQIKRVKEKEA